MSDKQEEIEKKKNNGQKEKIIITLLVVFLLIGAVAFAVLKDNKDEETEKEKEEQEQLEMESNIREATNSYLAAPKVVITADSLHEELNDGNASNDPYILDIRSEADYNWEHISGANNIGFRSVFDAESLETLPTDRQIVVVCYTGHTASQTTAMLNLAGYDAIALKFGFESWSDSSYTFNAETDAHEYDVELNTRCGGDDEPVTNDDDARGDDDITPEPTDVTGNIKVEAKNYLGEGKSPITKASALHDTLNDGDDTNDPFILDIRGDTDFGNGHIANSVNIGFNNVFNEDKIGSIPKDKDIVVVCYTGHTASQIAALLSINHYSATALKFGFLSWNFTLGGANAFTGAAGYDTVFCEDMTPLANAYLAENKAPATTASALHETLNDGDDTNDPFVLDIRGSEDYNASHIDGAVNIGFRNVFDTENLGRLPTDTQIVVVCYTGHTASQTTAMLNVAGFDAIALKWGFESWSEGGHTFNAETDAHEYEVETDDGTRCGGDEPEEPGDDDESGESEDEPDTTPFSSCSGAIRATVDAAANYLALGNSPITKASALHDTLNDGDDTNDPFILDIRSADDYAAGHVPGSVNIGFRSVFTADNVSLLPTDQQIVVVCYTGHTASQIAALLSINDYSATALKFGFLSWNFALGGAKAFPGSENYNAPSGDNLREAANDYLALGKSPITKASALHDTLNDGDDTNDPFILDIRGSDDFMYAHIDESVNIGFRNVFETDNLATLPTDKAIVVVCYTGHTASQTAALLNVAGYDATALKFGFESWAEGGHAFNATNDRVNGSTVTEATEAGTFENTELVVGSIADAANDYLALGKAPATKAATLQTTLEDGDDTNDPFILDIRGGTDYDAGHIAGAVNIGFRSVFTEENFSKLPSDQQIVVVCYTGHTASQITSLLNINGFDAIALKWGFESWVDGGYGFTGAAGYDTVGGENLRSASDEYLAMGKAPATSSSALNDNLNDGNTSNNPFILDIRAYDDYMKGHIATAINIGFRNVFETDNLALLPTDQQIVVVCYTGHTASQTTALLNVAGYDAIALKWGFEGWADGGRAFTGNINGTIETTAHESTVTEGPVELLTASIAGSANDYLALGKSPVTKADALQTTLEDGDDANDPFILDIRGESDYLAGHVPGAVNIGFRSVFTEENFSKLPSDKEIVVVCYTGHTASQIAALLNINGLDGSALKFGFEGWNEGGNAFGGPGNYPLVEAYNLREAANDYLALGKAPAMSASSLYDNLNDSNAENDPFLLDIRGAGDYEAGHIATSVNIGFRSVFTTENLSQLPTNQQIVVVCYTGHTASQTTALLSVVGYDAIALKWGFEGWGDGGHAFNASSNRVNGSLETQVNLPDTVDSIEIWATSIGDAANDYLALGKAPATSSSALESNLDDGNTSNDPFILDIRGESDYLAGHVPGAVNIGFRSVFTEENFTLLPTDRQIVVVCYSGHTASQITALLNINGLDAIALKWGFESWGDGGHAFPGAAGYNTVSGTEPGTW